MTVLELLFKYDILSETPSSIMGDTHHNIKLNKKKLPIIFPEKSWKASS